MSDTKSGDEKTLSVNTKKTLTLKRPGVEQGTVRQNFSHGRSKAVVVETKKRKFTKPGESETPQVVLRPRPAAPARPAAQAPQRPARPAPERTGMVLTELSQEEIEARRRALEGAKARELEERARAVEEARRRAEEEEQRRREREESARRQAEEEARIAREAEARKRAEEEAQRRAPEPPLVTKAVVEDDEDESPARFSAHKRVAEKVEAARPVPKPRGDGERRRSKLTLTSALAG